MRASFALLSAALTAILFLAWDNVVGGNVKGLAHQNGYVFTAPLLRRLGLNNNTATAQPTVPSSSSPSPSPSSTLPLNGVEDKAMWTQRLHLVHSAPHVSCPKDANLSIPFEENGKKMCPIPGLNNLLFTQVNRYYCAYRDKVKRLNLRAKVCMKYSRDWFRYGDILTINYSKPRAVPVCFGPDYPDPEKTNNIKHCEWRHVKEWYGTRAFWEARSHLSFNIGYTTFVDSWLAGNAPQEGGVVLPYLSLHVRRGDYFTHCIKLKKKKEPAWLSYSWNPKHNVISSEPYGVSCFPQNADIIAGIKRVVKRNAALRGVFISTNDEELVSVLKADKTINLPVFSLQFPGIHNATAELGLRGVDLAIIDMLLLAKGSAFILNKFSSFSATPYEIAMVEGRITNENLWWW